MSTDILNYNPMYLENVPDRSNKYTVTNEEWNQLWDLVVIASNDTAETLKTLLTKLANETWSLNGATYIKNPEFAPGAGTTVASQLSWLNSNKASVDYVDAAAQNFVMGNLADGSVTDATLSSSPEDIKARFSAHYLNDTNAHGINTLVKQTGGVMLGKLIGAENTEYGTAQFRNCIVSTLDYNAALMKNGEFWFKVKAV